MICSLINLFLIIKLKYINDYYLTLDKHCSAGYEAELTKYRYNINNYYKNKNNDKIFFQGTTFIIILIMSIIIISNIYNDIKNINIISMIIFIFLISFIYLYFYIIKIYNYDDDNLLNNYYNYYKKYNAIVKFVYNKNNNTNFVDEKVYIKNVINYEKFDNKKLDIDLIKNKKYENNDFMKYFIIDKNDEYLNELNDIIMKYTEKLNIFNENTINDVNIFKNNNIDITNLKPEYKKILLNINYSINNDNNYITLIDFDNKININVINNIIINENDENKYKLSTKILQHDKLNDYSDVYNLLHILYNIYNKNYDIIQEYLFYDKNILLNTIKINVSNYDYIKNITLTDKNNLYNYLIENDNKYYINVIDIYKINETNISNKLNDNNNTFFKQLFDEIKNSDSYLSDGMKILYQNNNYNKITNNYYIYIYLILFIILFTIILQFVSNFIQNVLYLYLLVIILLSFISIIIIYNNYSNYLNMI